LSLQGDLTSIPLADVMQMISSADQSGTLYVAADEAERVITFENGSVTSASTLEERFLLGNLLCRQGVIDPIQLNEALAKQKEYDLPLGETLLKMGVAQRETIDYVVRSQIQDGVNDVFRWRHGGFLFAESPKSESRASGSGFHVQPLLMEALRSLDEWELVAEKFTDRRRVPVFVEGKTQDEVEGASTISDSLALLELVDGRRSIDAIVTECGWNEHRCLSNLDQLLEIGMIRLEEGPTLQNYDPHAASAKGHHVPVMPRAGARAVAIAMIEQPDQIELRELALSDPGLAISLLRVAGILAPAGRRIERVTEAVELAGPEISRRALVAAGLRGLYATRGKPWDAMWRHSLAVSVAARLVARRIAQRSEEVEAARLAGLVHDIGCHLLKHAYGEAYDGVLAHAQKSGDSLVKVERARLGTGHDSVGASALAAWGASEIISEAVHCHHASTSKVVPKMAAVVSLAEGMADKCGFDLYGSRSNERLEARYTRLGISGPDMRIIERSFLQICAAKEPLW
jgi:HD-like signal output (HDOD) protein